MTPQAARVISAGPDYEALEAKLAQRMARWRHDPVLFVREAIGAEPTEQQRQILEAYGRGAPRLAVRSGHGIGKSSVGSWCAWHKLCCWMDARVPITAPTKHQLEDVLWAELAHWHREMEPWLSSQFEVRTDAIRHVRRPKTWFAVGRTGRKEAPDALQGFHGANLLFIADEASGIPAEVFQPVTGALTSPGNQIILLGNPIWLLGYFYEAFHRNRNQWATFTFSSEDSPLVSREWIEEMKATYGEGSDIYRIRVLGLHPRAAVNQLIPVDLVEMAMQRGYPKHEWIKAPRLVGVDVARQGGDASVILRRQGLQVLDVERYRGDQALDSMALAARVAAICREWNPHFVMIDLPGLGAGVIDRLHQLGWSEKLIPVSPGATASERNQFFNIRAEMWWRMREWLEAGGAIPNDGELRDDLIGPLYDYDGKGRIQLERKKHMRERGLASPDAADALAMTFVMQISQSVAQGEDRLLRPLPSEDTADTDYDPLMYGVN